jgi:protein-S-isoprenylcysteine O-methyltransferase Ste14
MPNLAALFPALTLALDVVAFYLAMRRLFRRPPSGLPLGARLTNLATALLVAYELHRVSRLRAEISWTEAAAMSGLHLLALAVFVWAWRSLSPAQPAIGFSWQLPQAGLAKRGPYRFVRHPLYLSYLVAWLAIPAVLLDPLGLAAAAGMAVIYVIAARQEEALLLRSELGAEYGAYHRRTPMLLPWRWPGSS